MEEWLWMITAGAIGGVVSTAFAGGVEVPLPPPLDRISTGWLLPVHVLRNAAAGALIAFLLWAGVADDGRSFSEKDIEPAAMSTAIVAGLAGTVAVNKLVRDNEELLTPSAACSLPAMPSGPHQPLQLLSLKRRPNRLSS